MNKRLTVLVVGAITIGLGGCGAEQPTATTMPAAAAPAPPAGAKTWFLKSSGRDALRLFVPADAECSGADGSVQLRTRDGAVEIWLVKGETSVDAAVARVDQQISEEFKSFKPAGATVLTIAGNPARKLSGPGTEADDGDPGEADVLIFKVGSNVFIACTHGENPSPEARVWMIDLAQTATAP